VHRVLHIDIDPVAVRVAKENIEHNHLSDRVRAVEGNLLASSDGVCDLCVAARCSLLPRAPPRGQCRWQARPLRRASPRRWRGCRCPCPRRFICSGIIKEREQDVINALTAADYTILETKRKGEWVAMLSRRKK